MSELVALVPDFEGRARVRRALSGRDVRFVECASEILELAALGGARAVLVCARDHDGLATAPFVRRLREGFPSTVIVGYCESGHSDDIPSLVRAGVDDLVFRGTDDVRLVLPDVLARAEQHTVAEIVLAELRGTVAAIAYGTLAYLLEHAGDPPTVTSAAGALGLDRKTLVNRMTKAQLPPPSLLVAWARLLAAARLLEDAGRSVEQVAHLLNYGSANALRNMLKRHTGLRPIEVRESGGFRCVLELFKAALIRGRSEPAA
jgi:AraC-like DNA-binding protein